MRSNNNCSKSRLLEWFPCFYHQTEQGNRRQHTSLRLRCGIARLTIYMYFLNLSPVNAKLTSLSYIHVSLQTVMRLKIIINVRRLAYANSKSDCRLMQKFHKTKAHDEMTEICRCYKLPVNKVIFVQFFPELYMK